VKQKYLLTQTGEECEKKCKGGWLNKQKKCALNRLYSLMY